MKTVLIIGLILSKYILTIGQNNYWMKPYAYNKFVNKANISWACEMHNEFSFKGINDSSFNIHAYLKYSQKTGKIKSYLTADYPDYEINKWAKGWSDDYFYEIKKEKNLNLENIVDSCDLIKFFEILFIEDQKLKSQIISAGVEYKFVTSHGVYLGNSTLSSSSLNYYGEIQTSKNDELFYLGTNLLYFNSDSIEPTNCLKKSYGMSLPLALWYNAATGITKIRDLKTNKFLKANEVMEYSVIDSIENILIIDSLFPKKQMTPGPPAYSYLGNVEIEQKWYYNKTKDIFFSKINKAFLYIISANTIEPDKKRFEIIFE